jgi:hypothetical protein
MGLGGRLVDTCVGFARAAGYAHMRLWTNHPLVAVRHVYLVLGFHLVEEQPHGGRMAAQRLPGPGVVEFRASGRSGPSSGGRARTAPARPSGRPRARLRRRPGRPCGGLLPAPRRARRDMSAAEVRDLTDPRGCEEATEVLELPGPWWENGGRGGSGGARPGGSWARRAAPALASPRGEACLARGEDAAVSCGPLEDLYVDRVTGGLAMFDRMIFKGHLSALYKQDGAGASCGRRVWRSRTSPTRRRPRSGSPTTPGSW